MLSDYRRKWLDRKQSELGEAPHRREEIVRAVVRWILPLEGIAYVPEHDALFHRDAEGHVYERPLRHCLSDHPEIAVAVRGTLPRLALAPRPEAELRLSAEERALAEVAAMEGGT